MVKKANGTKILNQARRNEKNSGGDWEFIKKYCQLA